MTSQISDLTEKLSRAENSITNRATITSLAPEAASAKATGSTGPANGKGKEKDATTAIGSSAAPQPKDETALSKVVKDGKKITVECHHGMMWVKQLIILMNHTYKVSLGPPVDRYSKICYSTTQRPLLLRSMQEVIEP